MRGTRTIAIVSFTLALLPFLLIAAGPAAGAEQPEQSAIDIGDRRELFVDHYLIDKLQDARLRLHEPQHAGIVWRHDAPWEGVYSGYTTVFRDGDIYRMYFLGYPVTPAGQFTCYAESKNGIEWVRPKLGLVEFQGSKDNNILLANLAECHNFSPFLDANPTAPPAQRYKAVGGQGAGLMVYASADGIRWSRLRDTPVITEGAFDSHNLAFYSEAEKQYVCYYRIFQGGVRWVARVTSADFLNWSKPAPMTADPPDAEHLYTNSTTAYFRAPHIYIALPSRFMQGRDAVTQEQKEAAGVEAGYLPKGSGFNDMPLITSRGGDRYDRTFMETFIPVGIGVEHWTSRANYPAFGIVPTPDSQTHLSLYVNHHTGYKSAHIAAYKLRYDGFISVHAPASGGELLTKPFKFDGKKLTINYATSAIGSVRVEIQDAAGTPLKGLADCQDIVGDEIERTVNWRSGSDLSQLAGQAIRLRFVMRAADLYSLRFVP